MKFLFTADIHLSRYAQDKVASASNLPERLHSIRQSLDYMAEYACNNNVQYFIIGGDIMHSKSIIYSIAQNLMLDFFESWNNQLEFFVLDGNHDLSGKGADAISSLRSLEHMQNMDWITKMPDTGPLMDILCIPYSHNIVDHVKQNQRKILISHFGLNEGVLNSGISIQSNISLADLYGKYELVLLGHYHKPQEIITDNIKLYYVGSPIQLDWGEKGDEKRFLVVDTDTMDVKSIPTIGYKKHIELEINNANKDEILAEAKKAKDSGDLVKIIKTETVDIASKEFSIIDKSEKDITDRGITSSMSEADRLEKYLQIKEISTDKIERFKYAGLSIVDSSEGE